MKKISRILILLLILVVAAAITFVYVFSKRAIPDYSQDLKLTGLQNEVTVYRDQNAIPHIYAHTEEDLYRATGYIMAQDRMWQMDLLRRATQGRLSEIFGADMIETDLLLRALRIPEKSKLIWSKTTPEMKVLFEAYADGVNQYIENQKGSLPPEFGILGYSPEKWKPEHSFNLVGYMSWDLSTAWYSEVQLYKISQKVSEEAFKMLVPDVAGQSTAIYRDFEHELSNNNVSNLLEATAKLSEYGLHVFNGSNNWAVSGAKSTDGKPMLSNDMHLGFFAPGIWYQMHQHVEGKLNVTGVAVPGQPMVVCGHNEDIAWGMTNVMLDDIDFYIETINPDNERQYKLDGEWKDFEIHREHIKVKGGETVEKELWFNHRGPVISKFKDVDDEVITMRWTGNEYSNEVRSIYLVNRAKNWGDFRTAMKTFSAISQNVIYADKEGNIGLQCCAGVPIRKNNDGSHIFKGETSESDWLGLVPFDKLPFEFNPERGYVYSANNKTVGDDYPYYISSWFLQPFRADRIVEMLEEKEKLSIDDFKNMLGDVKSKYPEKILPKLLIELEQNEFMNKEELKYVSLLKNWNYTMDSQSIEASLFELFYNALLKNLIKDELEDELYNEYIGFKILFESAILNILDNPDSEIVDNINTDGKETFNEIVRISFIDAISYLKDNYGKDTKKWQWGNIHQLQIKHPMGKIVLLDKVFGLNTKSYPVGGSYHTVCPYSYKFTDKFAVVHGASHRHIFTTSDWDKSLTVIPTGTSGIPASDYYCDQTEMYVNNQFHSDLFSDENAIKESAKYVMKFTGK